MSSILCVCVCVTVCVYVTGMGCPHVIGHHKGTSLPHQKKPRLTMSKLVHLNLTTQDYVPRSCWKTESGCPSTEDFLLWIKLLVVGEN